VVVPVTITPGLPRTSVRVPVIVIDETTGDRGVKAFDTAEYAPQPAPFNARTVAVYLAPFVRPLMVHVNAGTAIRHVCPPGDTTA
jgi:hypothetical protein